MSVWSETLHMKTWFLQIWAGLDAFSVCCIFNCYPRAVSTLYDTMYQRAICFLSSKLWFENLAVNDWEYRKTRGSRRVRLMFPGPWTWDCKLWVAEAGRLTVGGSLFPSAPNPGNLIVGRRLSHSQQTLTRLILWQSPWWVLGLYAEWNADTSLYYLLKWLYVSLCSLLQEILTECPDICPFGL